jgi:hypothetical protein
VHSPILILVLAVVGWAVAYWISLRLHPFTKCKTCSGTGRHRGAIFTSASRACGTCGGSSRVLRQGVRMFVNNSTMKYRR